MIFILDDAASKSNIHVGFFYGGYGAIITPFFGVSEVFGTHTAEYNNALGFFVLIWTVFNTFFFISSLSINLVYALLYGFVELSFALIAASYFATADGNMEAALAVKKAAGAFAFLAGMCGWYTVGNLMCKTSLFFDFPMGDTSRFFARKRA
jgi:succinate-acetate transporter protein